MNPSSTLSIPLLFIALMVATTEGSHGESTLLYRGGLNASNMSFDPELENGARKDSRIGYDLFVLGQFGSYYKPMSLMLGLGYEAKRLNVTGPFGDEKIRFGYLRFPFRLSFSKEYDYKLLEKLYLNLGVDLAVKLFSEAETGYSRTGAITNMRDYDFPVVSEIGVDIPTLANNICFLLGSGLSYGLVNLKETGSGSAHHYAYHLITGLRFKFGK